ncbi:MAG: hypothetical protein V3S80_03295 [Sulfurimonadaceae bacterium]
MKKLLLLMLTLSSLAYATVIIGQPIKPLSLNDQFDVEHNITSTTKKVIFTFKKASSHIVKDYLATQEADYLAKRDAMYVADVSAMPAFISFFVLPMLTSNEFPILVIEDEEQAEAYKNEEHIEAVMLVILEDSMVVDIKYINSEKDLIKEMNK